jgi:hypothetical protein
MRRCFRLFALLAATMVVVLPAQTMAQGTLSTILTNGPTAKRINIVVLSEGYMTNELGKFLEDATNAVNDLLALQPYLEYRGYFNAFAISNPAPITRFLPHSRT